ncbi:hypothetical protein K1719_003325 [Acacia pycnantha]|nr:hypothetical protein K1719_003325 [Acacia pycnantha]
MASKRYTTDDTPSLDHEEPQSTPQSIPKRPPRTKTFPKRFKEGIDKTIPGVTTTQPSSPSRTRDSTPQNPPNAETAPRRGKEKVYKSKRSKENVPAPGQASSQAHFTSHHQEQSVPRVSEETPALFEIYNHTSIPRGFSSEPVRLSGEDAIRYKENFEHKAFCPTVYINLAQLKEECNLDLTPWLKQFEPLISIRASYSSSLVKAFYHCLKSDNLLDNDRKLVEERITTTIRGKKITLTAAYLNSLLQIQNPPPVASLNYTDRQIFSLLKPDEPIPGALEILNFTPVSTPPKQRAAWYIYTRNLIQKGENFTHFAKKDFPIFASIIDQVPHNIGHWILREMARFRFSGRKSSQIPFASLISVIMFNGKIWYLPANKQPENPQKFGKHILNLMRINFDEGSDQSRAPPQSRPTRSRATQSRIESEVKQFKEDVNKGFDEMVDAQEDLTLEHEALKENVQGLSDQIGDQSVSISTLLVYMASLSDKMDKILQHQSMSASGLGASTYAGPSSTISPIISEPTSTSIAPEPSIPAATTSDPTIPPYSTPTDPPLFVDDKGGEELK